MTAGANGKRMTPTEERLMAVLGDGEPHSREELVACLNDELSSWDSVKSTISVLRKKLHPGRQTIVCQVLNRKFKYRLVGLIIPKVKSKVSGGN
jgi:hypothetical protein